MFTKLQRLKTGARAVVFLAGLNLALLLFMDGCRPQEMDQAAPRESAPSSSPTALSQAKDQSPQKIAILPTSTKPLAAAPTPLPAASTPAPETAPITFEQPPRRANFLVEATVTAVPPTDCNERMPGSDLYTIVTLDYGLHREFEPGDLVPLAGHVPYTVTLGYPTEVREVILQPLVDMINDMLSADLHPQVLSGYRSYASQAIAWNKWQTIYPDRASIISAPPGHSEHQLGTVIDFGSPELPGIVGQPGIQFHTYFYKTSEGQWLAENAFKYGFTLSYPLEAFETTGFYYEPWHYRYVGKSMAEQLHALETSLTELQLANEPPPCLP